MQSLLYVTGPWSMSIIKRITSVLIIFFISATTQAQTLIPELSFRNPVLQTGQGLRESGQDGAVYIFEQVGFEMDAVVTILGRSSEQVHLSNMDINGPVKDSDSGTGDEDAWQPQIVYGDGTVQGKKDWWMEFIISFVKHEDHQQPAAVNQFYVSGLDIDGDGKELHEYQSYYKTQSFTLEHETGIFASAVQGSELDPMLDGKRFDGTTKDYPGISMTAEDAIVRNFYTGSSSMIVRLGAETGPSGSMAGKRMYGLLFRSMLIDVPQTGKTDVYFLADARGLRMTKMYFQF